MVGQHALISEAKNTVQYYGAAKWQKILLPNRHQPTVLLKIYMKVWVGTFSHLFPNSVFLCRKVRCNQ